MSLIANQTKCGLVKSVIFRIHQWIHEDNDIKNRYRYITNIWLRYQKMSILINEMIQLMDNTYGRNIKSKFRQIYWIFCK